jgi:hypothetical protein
VDLNAYHQGIEAKRQEEDARDRAQRQQLQR